MADWIFLDNHSRTRPSIEIINQMSNLMQTGWLLSQSEKPNKALLEVLGFKEEDHFFLMSGSEESHFHALLSHYVNAIRETGRTHILTLETDQSSFLETIQVLEKFDVQGQLLPVNENGQLEPKVLQERLRARSSLLALSLADPLTGVVQPVMELAKLCHDHDVRMHLDIGCAIGKLYFPFAEIEGISSISFDGGLFHCPEGMAGLIVRKGEASAPLGKRTERPASCMALAHALEKALDSIDHMALETARLRDDFEESLSSAHIFFNEVERLPTSSVVAFEGIHAETLLFHLKKRGLFATTGGGRLAHLLKSCGVEPMLAHSALSFALSKETTKEEIDRAGEIITETVEKLRPLGAYAK